jgi:hypothetical protein
MGSLLITNSELLSNIDISFVNTSVENFKSLAGVGENDEWDDETATGLRKKINAKKEELGLNVCIYIYCVTR